VASADPNPGKFWSGECKYIHLMGFRQGGYFTHDCLLQTGQRTPQHQLYIQTETSFFIRMKLGHLLLQAIQMRHFLWKTVYFKQAKKDLP
jgi:hypothetical protein